jgi:hypothetical protein
LPALARDQQSGILSFQNFAGLAPRKSLQAQLFLIRGKYGIRLTGKKTMPSACKIKINAKRGQTASQPHAPPPGSVLPHVGAGFSSPRASKGRALLSESRYGIVKNRMGNAQEYTILPDLTSSSNRLANRQCNS